MWKSLIISLLWPVLAWGQCATTETDTTLSYPATCAVSIPSFSFSRPVSSGTPLQDTDFAASAGFGDTASFSAVTGTDTGFGFTISSSGTGQAANPTATLTYADGAWPAAPHGACSRVSGDQPTVNPVVSTTTTTFIVTFPGTPVAGESYAYACLVNP